MTDSGSPPLGQTASFVVDVVDDGPAATIARARVNIKRGLTIALRFSQPLDAPAAGDLGDYILVRAKKKSKKAPAPANIPLAVSYDAATSTVTLTAKAKVKRRQTLRLTVIGSGPDGIAKVTGLPLAGDGVHIGTNYVATITGRTIKQTNAASRKHEAGSPRTRRMCGGLRRRSIRPARWPRDIAPPGGGRPSPDPARRQFPLDCAFYFYRISVVAICGGSRGGEDRDRWPGHRTSTRPTRSWRSSKCSGTPVRPSWARSSRR